MVGVSFSKRDLVWFVPLVVIMIVGFGVAFGGDEPSVMGHSAGEIEVVTIDMDEYRTEDSVYQEAALQGICGGIAYHEGRRSSLVVHGDGVKTGDVLCAEAAAAALEQSYPNALPDTCQGNIWFVSGYNSFAIDADISCGVHTYLNARWCCTS